MLYDNIGTFTILHLGAVTATKPNEWYSGPCCPSFTYSCCKKDSGARCLWVAMEILPALSFLMPYCSFVVFYVWLWCLKTTKKKPLHGWMTCETFWHLRFLSDCVYLYDTNVFFINMNLHQVKKISQALTHYNRVL